MVVSSTKIVLFNIKELIVFFAWTVDILALSNVKVNDTNHGHLFLLVSVYAARVVGYLVDLNQSIDVRAKSLYIGLHQSLYSILPQALHKVNYQGYAHDYNNYVAINGQELHK